MVCVDEFDEVADFRWMTRSDLNEWKRVMPPICALQISLFGLP
jgi:hypothetical protein